MRKARYERALAYRIPYSASHSRQYTYAMKAPTIIGFISRSCRARA